MIPGDKGALRLAARRRRRALQAERPTAGEDAAGLYPSLGLGPFRTAALYWPSGSEIDPMPLGRLLAASGAQLCLPTVAASDCALEFRSWSPQDPMASDALGLAAPSAHAPSVRPELVVLPMLAFDRFGGRLGQGGGYYDRTVEQLRRQGPVFVLGLAFAGQEAERLPAEAHDEPLDAVLTESGFRRFSTKDA